MTALTLTTVTLDAPDPTALASFYAALLGWSVTTNEDEPDWVVVRDPAGGVGLAFQTETKYRPPVWPATGTEQQMMVHLEIRVDDLDSAVQHALACGATLPAHQPQDDVRVCLDPVGHPFCLWIKP